MFTARAVEATAPCTYRQIDEWVRRRLAHATREARGKGDVRWFLGDDYEHIRMMARLVDAGVTPELASYLASMGEIPLNGGQYVLRVEKTDVTG